MKLKNAFVTSDHHFGHNKMANLRGFSTSQAFTDAYINAHNYVVKAHHAVLFLGDVCMSRESLGIIKLLNGSKHLVLGNHDQFTHEEYIEAGFKSVSAMKFSSTIGAVFTHYPVHQSYFDFRQKDWANFHGHLHTMSLPGPYINCCIEKSLTPRPVSDLRHVLT
jgi:calcineurin-like phosphoesterase family protein